jgi:DNA-binding response OmpR family regulator
VDVNGSIDLDELVHMRHALPSPILLLIGVTDEDELVNAYRAGIDDHLGKPVSLSMLGAKLLVWQRWVNQVHAVK